MRRREHTWHQSNDMLRVADQYAGRPELGLAISVRHRTTNDGRGVVLSPDQVVELRHWLGQWLAGADSPAVTR